MNKALFNLIRPHYRQLQGYVSAGMEVDKSADKVFLNANENPYQLPGLEGFNRYPEPQPRALLQAYAQTYDVLAKNIVMTRGADEAIALLTRLFCEPGKDSALICSPTFGMYGVNARAMPASVVDVSLIKHNGTFVLDRQQIIQQATQTAVKLVYLCSPNNPTGTSFEQSQIKQICQQTKGQAIVVVDETYIEFSEQASISRWLSELPNLIILRTLSKSYSMAGMRMGTLLSADVEFIQLMRTKCLDAYPLPKASTQAALTALSPAIRKIAKQNIQTLLAERKRLQAAIENLPKITYVYPSDANFLLIEMSNAHDFIDYCAEQNIILRDFSDIAGTENCIRVSIGIPEQNNRLIALFNDF